MILKIFGLPKLEANKKKLLHSTALCLEIFVDDDVDGNTSDVTCGNNGKNKIKKILEMLFLHPMNLGRN